jgi:hypothetical protein
MIPLPRGRAQQPINHEEDRDHSRETKAHWLDVRVHGTTWYHFTANGTCIARGD